MTDTVKTSADTLQKSSNYKDKIFRKIIMPTELQQRYEKPYIIGIKEADKIASARNQKAVDNLDVIKGRQKEL